MIYPKAPEIFSAREIALFLGPNIVSSVDPFWSGTFSYALPYNCENFASILGSNEIKYEFDIDSSAVNQEPDYRDWRAITDVCNPNNEEGTSIQEQALPSIYGAYNPNSQKQFERGDFHVTWYAFVLPNSHFRTNRLSLIFSSKSWSRASFYQIHSFKLFDVLPNSQIRTDSGSNLWIK